MSHELSMAELEGELVAELPTRNLMRRRHRRSRRFFGTSAFASFGSAANANSTEQVNFNPQIVINNGFVGGSGIHISSHNENNNFTNQSAVPINFGN
jgi:hypothetical protein